MNTITVRVGKFDESKGHGFDLTIDPTSLGFPAEVFEGPMADVARGIIRIGLRNILTDTHASIAANEPNAIEKAVEKVNQRLNAMQSGQFARERESDPVASEVTKMVEAAARKQVRAQHSKGPLPKEALDAARKSIREKNGESFRKTAEKIVALRAALVVE